MFDKEDGGVQKSFGKLAEVIGYPVTCEPEWHMIFTELESANPDKTTFVPAISILVEAWSATLLRRLEDDSFAAWTEELLQKLKPAGAVKLLIEVREYCGESTNSAKATDIPCEQSKDLLVQCQIRPRPPATEEGPVSNFAGLFRFCRRFRRYLQFYQRPRRAPDARR